MTPRTIPAGGEFGTRSRRLRARFGRTLALAGSALLAWLISASLFTVDVTEYGAVTRFGHIVRIVESPGLQVKLPFDRVVRLDKRILYFIPAQAEYLTADQKNLVVHSLLTWRIVDPYRFLNTVVTRATAEVQLGDIVLAGIGTALGRYSFSSLISSENKDGGFRQMISEVRGEADSVARREYGIEVVHFRIRRLQLPEQNKRYVFERMKAERGRIAMRYRSEGEQELKKITAAADREKTRIMAEAYKEAAEIKGEADAKVIGIYGTKFARDPKFYKFLRTLQAYKTILDEKTTIFMPADADLFHILKDDSAPAAAAAGR